jgi:TonB-linked SusC/RagA family outer membrane protein
MASFGQTLTVTGTVKNAAGEGLLGVTVMIPNTATGTATDINGNYSLRGVPGDAMLEYAFIGYETLIESVNNRSVINITLAEDSQVLEEVVVVGYGTQKKANLTGSVATVGADRIESKPVTNLMAALTGEAAGLTIMQRSGQPGANASQSMRVRGVGTWEDAEPLVLVDGVAMSINDVIPSDVESVTVLKDAASAAIYGARAANGVILITTKRGEKGTMRLSYSGNVGIETPTRLPDMVNSWQFAEMWSLGMANQGTPSDLYPADRIARMKAGGDIDKQEGNTDWYGEVIKPAARQMHQFTANGGSDRLTYMASLGYNSQDGIMMNTDWERYNARINTRAKLTDWFELGFNVTYQTSDRSEPAGGAEDVFYQLAKSIPNIPVKYSDGTWSFLSIQKNPVRKANGDYGMRKYMNNSTMILLSPQVNLAKGLVFNGTFGYQTSNSLSKRFDKIVNYSEFINKEGVMQQAGTVDNNYDGARNQQTDNWGMNRNMTATGTFTYEVELNKHDIKAMIGGSTESYKTNSGMASRYDFPSNDYTEVDAGNATTSTNSGNAGYRSIASLFGRINYVFDDKYLFEANFRYDGSSKFARGERWGFFPSVSAGWRISEEPFFAGAKEIIPNLKLRASWGRLGNQSIGDHQFLSTFGSSNSAFYVFGNGATAGYTEARMGNSLITWETSTNLNFGLDFALFDSRLNASFDWYDKMTDDILLNLPAPSSLGISAPTSNAGSVRNRGWELTLDWRDKIFNGQGSYRVGFNLADVKNEVTDLKGYTSSTANLTTRIEGYPINSIFGYETVGIAMRPEDVEKYGGYMKKFNGNWALGDLILKDQNGDGVINGADKKVIGNQIPRYTFGLSLGFDYKKFDFSAFLQGVGKVDGYVMGVMMYPLQQISGRVDHFEKSFDPAKQNYDAWYPRMLATWNHNYEYQSWWMQNAAYLRLKNLSVGYTFALPQLGISRMRVSLSGENVFTLTKFRVWDPETPVGVERVYPLTSVYSFGLSVTF